MGNHGAVIRFQLKSQEDDSHHSSGRRNRSTRVAKQKAENDETDGEDISQDELIGTTDQLNYTVLPFYSDVLSGQVDDSKSKKKKSKSPSSSSKRSSSTKAASTVSPSITSSVLDESREISLKQTIVHKLSHLISTNRTKLIVFYRVLAKRLQLQSKIPQSSTHGDTKQIIPILPRAAISFGLKEVLNLDIPYLLFSKELGIPTFGVNGKQHGPIDYMVSS